MDQDRFDDLSRSVATSLTRRTALRGTAMALLAALGHRAGGNAQVTQAQCGNKICKNNPGKCTDGCVCCLYPNGNSRCRPPGTCAPGTVACPNGQRYVQELGRCVGCLTDSDCPDSSPCCIEETCTGVSATFAQCQGACTCPTFRCPNYQYFPTVEICGRQVACPSCETCPTGGGCNDLSLLPTGPLGESWYCTEFPAVSACDPSAPDCPSGTYCSAFGWCEAICNEL